MTQTARCWLAGSWQEIPGIESLRPSPVDGSELVHVEADLARVMDLLPALAELPEIACPPEQRIAALCQLADALEADAPRFAAMLTMENGCPSAQSEALQVRSSVALLRAMATLGERFEFVEERAAFRGGRVRIHRQPVGLALGIVPWNVPLFLAAAKLASSLIAGCPLLLKPSPENAPSMQAFAELVSQLDLPAGAVNIVIGGRELGASLVAHPAFQKVSFTGSTAAGKQVAVACAARMARCTLELGGKSAAVLLDDVRLEDIRSELFLAMLQNNGQVCGAQSRVLLPASRYAELRDGLVALFESLKLGDPREPDTQVGPLMSAGQASRVHELCDQGEQAGARLLTQTSGPDHDAYIAPRLFDQAMDTPLWSEEAFGPVIVLEAYRDEAQARELANASRFGLSGSVWASDTQRAAAFAGGLRTGTVGINSKKILDFAAPFGGWRESGLGREFGPEGIQEYLEETAVLIP
ncbi:MAG: aldehyde dehydrogenase [Congregibacter sp.]